jgi:AraC family transcriptional regulator of adaptative response/methylated-DNA-[protein]-cysteine methyltransferase
MTQTSEAMAITGRTERLDPDVAWTAVVSRDRRFDGRFVYAVASTGIFCRPTCPSRRPDRRHVAFFDGPAAARAAGFRPCLRCAPESSAGPGAAVERTRGYIDAHLDERLTLEALAPVAGLSPTHLQRAFKAALGLSPRDYVRARRTERFKAEVREGRSITEALYGAGYGSGSRLYEDAGARIGMTPGAFKRGGEGQMIRYTTAESPLGRLLVASTERGVCAVQIGESDHALEATLGKEYPRAERRRDDRALRPALAAILAHIDGSIPRLDLPVDVAATAFQWRVWRALQEIPYGETRSYGQVAKAVGRPRAVRAVARACATNRVALLVPCHRVVRADGSLGGYRWGAARKRRLLDGEKATSKNRADRGTTS